MSKNNKIALLTWYKYQNFGTALQASALFAVISSWGYSTTIINYSPKGDNIELKKSIILYLIRKLLSKIHKRITHNIVYKSKDKDRLFAEYIKKHLNESEACTCYSELHDLNEQYDAFVCGSDQIWSPLCYDDKYFLSFVDNTNKMIAYAPSIGSVQITNEYIRQNMSEHISRFQHLSVREAEGRTLIKQMTKQEAKVVLDPTLLLNAEAWDQMTVSYEKLNILDTNYMICYFLGPYKRYMKYVRTFSRQIGMRIYIIPVTVAQARSKYVVPFEVGPNEFVALLRNASYVFTDSFHGMAFSCNYNIPFTVFKRFKENDPRNQNSRIVSLLRILNLEERLVDYNATVEYKECDFTDANTRLERQRIKSLEYLKTALAEAVNDSGEKQEHSEYKITDICCGCGACAAICPQKAIVIKQDKEGFEHYFIDQNRCVKCGRCKTVCPFINIGAAKVKKARKLYAMKSTCKENLVKSSSGAVAYEISKRLLMKGYFVCGCVYDRSSDSARHIMIPPEQKDKLHFLQGSKYIQSLSAEIMRKIECMQNKQQIVFVGTPCQTAAVDKLLQRKDMRKNAILVDLICHGVPSYFLWEKYIQERVEEDRVGIHPPVIFRSPASEWRKMTMELGSNRRYFKNEDRDDFYAFFRRGICYMRSCFECPYRERSAADIRIGDYWGPRFEQDKTGVSMVITNTEKGEELVQELIACDLCSAEEQNLSEYWTVQYPTNPHMPIFREQLLKDLHKDSKKLSSLRKEYCRYYDVKEKAKKIGKLVRRK